MGLAADPHVTESPAIAVPEPLPLPDAAAAAIVAGRGDIGRTAVIAWRGCVIARSISIIIRGGRGADDGTTDQSARYSGAKVPLCVGGSRSRHS